MAVRVEVLDADPVSGRQALAVVVVLVLALVGGAALLRRSPPEPVTVSLERLNGSALSDESFVRLYLRLSAEGAGEIDAVRLRIAGADQLGQHPRRFDEDGRVTVLIDLTPRCPGPGQVLPAGPFLPGTLDLQLRDAAGDRRLVQLDVPSEGPLERLIRYRCA